MKIIKRNSYVKVKDLSKWGFLTDLEWNKLDYKIITKFIRADQTRLSEDKKYKVIDTTTFKNFYILLNEENGLVYKCEKEGLIHYDDYIENKVEESIEDEEEIIFENRDIKEMTKIVSKELNKNLEEIKSAVSRRTDFENAMIEGIIEKGKSLSVKDIEEKLKNNLDEYIEKNYGVLPKKIVYIDDEIERESTGLYHYKFEDICKIIKKDIPLMLTGPAGAGKNHTIEQVAQVLGLDFYFTNSITQEYKLTGFIDANGTYHETEFYKAFTNGGIFFLDEVDASVPEALIILNSAIANRYFDFPTGRVVAHKDFRVVCAGNTYGTGADMIYVGRNVLDGATLDRFVCIEFDYDEEIEKSLAYDMELYEFIKDLRKTINDNSLRYIISMRAIINATKMLEIGFDKKTILKEAIIKNMQIDDVNTIIRKFNKTNNEWYREFTKFGD